MNLIMLETKHLSFVLQKFTAKALEIDTKSLIRREFKTDEKWLKKESKAGSVRQKISLFLRKN